MGVVIEINCGHFLRGTGAIQREFYAIVRLNSEGNCVTLKSAKLYKRLRKQTVKLSNKLSVGFAFDYEPMCCQFESHLRN